ncbi:MAG TPA: MFS transporter [Mycobacteriales bacterium]|nr:MFS transporter [Mycobacteriales bacterium]
MLSLCLIVTGMDVLIIAMALPNIQRGLGATVGDLQWTVDGYSLGFGGLLLLAGGLADRFGRKLTLLVGLAFFLLFSVGAAFAPTTGALIGFRLAMGIGSALIMPSTLAIIKNVFPKEEQTKAVSIWTAAAGAGVPLGPIVGGLLLDHFWWGSIFLINVPFVGLTLLAALWLVPESRNDRHPGLDVVGVVLSVLGLATLVYGLIEAPRYGWGDPRTIGLLALGVALLVAFVQWERRVTKPMLSSSLFRDARFSGATGSIVCIAFALYGGLFILTQYLQFGELHDPLQTGLRLLVVCVLIIPSGLSPRVVQWLGLKFTVSAGIAVLAVGMAILSTSDLASEGRALLGLGVIGFGLGLAMPAAADSILAAAPARQSGAGSAATDASMQVGGALGIAVIGSVLTTSYRGALPDLNGFAEPVRQSAQDSLGGAVSVAGGLGHSGSQLLASANAAFDTGLAHATFVGFVIAAIGAVFAAVMLPRRAVTPAGAAAGGSSAMIEALGDQKGASR